MAKATTNLNLNFDLHQRQADAVTSNATELLYGGAASGGKGGKLLTDGATLRRLGVSEDDITKIQELKLMEHQVLTPKGFVALSDITVGQQVCNPDGTTSEVIAIHDRGIQPFYKLTFIDDAQAEVDASHLWPISFAGRRKNRKRKLGEIDKEQPSNEEWNQRYNQRFKLTTTEALYKRFHLEKDKFDNTEDERSYWPMIPLTAPVTFTSPPGRWPILPPYTIGVLLGDGSLTMKNSVSWTKPDPEIAEMVSAELLEEDQPYEVSKRAAEGCYGIIKKENATEPVGAIIERLGINVHSYEKFIPKPYLETSVERRYALARGLLDTDGYADDRGHVEYTSSSERLARDVQWLVRSLGFAATITLKPEPTYTYEGEQRIGRPSWRIYIKGRNTDDLFSLPRKKERCRKYLGGVADCEPNRRLISIEKSGDFECRCITVSNPNGLYLTNDFIVTHNSHLARVMALLWCLEIPGIQIYFFRRLYDDLIKNHIEGPTGFRAMMAPWLNGKHAKSPLTAGRLAEIIQGEIRFWNGSKIFLCHLQHQKDITKYYGVEIHAAFIEEATQFSEFMIRFVRSRLRIPKALKIPYKYMKPKSEWKAPDEPDYYFPRMVYTSNPGGIGHQYIKKAFIDGFKPYELHIAPNDDGGHSRQFIPARVDDNPSVNREEVKSNLSGLPPVLVDALLNGNWNAVVGAFFPEINPELHLVKPFNIPNHWIRIMGLDWGACGEGDPFSIQWWAVSDGESPLFPRGALICYNSWWGKGLPKTNVDTVIRGIRERERKDGKITYRVAGGDIEQKRGTGPSIYEMFASEGLHFNRADNRRGAGAIQLRERITGKGGRPMAFWFDTFSDELETIMGLQHDINDPNDCTQHNDDNYDCTRYVMMSRPYAKDKPISAVPFEQRFKPPTINQLWEMRDASLRGRR